MSLLQERVYHLTLGVGFLKGQAPLDLVNEAHARHMCGVAAGLPDRASIEGGFWWDQVELPCSRTQPPKAHSALSATFCCYKRVTGVSLDSRERTGVPLEGGVARFQCRGSYRTGVTIAASLGKHSLRGRGWQLTVAEMTGWLLHWLSVRCP